MTEAAAAPAKPRPPIRRLDPSTVARIAAGEVVEGPATVVKELVENARDAGAREVRVALESGGLVSIRVSDDGYGIEASELPLALERHATSKLSSGAELTGISTLGFRGEALASIASVSRLSIASRPPGEEIAHGLKAVGDAAPEPFETGAPSGTSVEVGELFFNTPARRKFLRSPAAEQVEVARTLGALYLADPRVGLTLESDGTEIARYPPTPDLAEAAVRVFGEELIGRIVSINARVGDDEAIELRAALSAPAVSRGTSAGLHVSINRRPIVDRALSQAVRLAYDDYLPKGRYPLGAVALTIDPARVDVNVHPTKREVRIARSREIAEAVRRAIRTALRSTVPAADLGARALPSSRGAATSPAPPRAFSVPLGGLASVRPRSARPGPTLIPPAPERPVAATRSRPALTLLGSLFRLYWVAESESSLVLIDQHAASERVVYETLRREGRLARQELVEPVALAMTARQLATLDAQPEEIERAGFVVARFGPGRVRVNAIPVYRGRRASASTLPELLDELASGGRPTVPNGLVERRAASLACHAAVRGGDTISSEEMGRILDALYRLEGDSYACPHGRPILISFDRARLDGWFLRRGA